MLGTIYIHFNVCLLRSLRGPGQREQCLVLPRNTAFLGCVAHGKAHAQEQIRAENRKQFIYKLSVFYKHSSRVLGPTKRWVFRPEKTRRFAARFNWLGV